MNIAVDLSNTLRREGLPHVLTQEQENDIYAPSICTIHFPNAIQPLLSFSCRDGSTRFILHDADKYWFTITDAHKLITEMYLRIKE